MGKGFRSGTLEVSKVLISLNRMFDFFLGGECWSERVSNIERKQKKIQQKHTEHNGNETIKGERCSRVVREIAKEYRNKRV